MGKYIANALTPPSSNYSPLNSLRTPSPSKDQLIACPGCGHSAYDHWNLGSGTYDEATKGQKPNLVMRWFREDEEGNWSMRYGVFASNSSPGNLPKKGCFKATAEHYKPNPNITPDGDCLGTTYYDFCDCPMDQETALALIRKGTYWLKNLPKSNVVEPDEFPEEFKAYAKLNPDPKVVRNQILGTVAPVEDTDFAKPGDVPRDTLTEDWAPAKPKAPIDPNLLDHPQDSRPWWKVW
jgi:hypothetical protein